MEDLIAWEADPLAFKVTTGDDGYGVKDTDDGGDNDGYYVKYEDDGDYGIALNLMEVFGTLLSRLPFDTFPSKNAQLLGNYLSSVTSYSSWFQLGG